MTQGFPPEPEENPTPRPSEGGEELPSTERPTVLSSSFSSDPGLSENKPEQWEESIPPISNSSIHSSNEEKTMAETYPTPPPPPQVVEPGEPPKKNNRTIWIIVIVAVLLLCCCCIVGVVLLVQSGVMNEINYSSLLSLARLI